MVTAAGQAKELVVSESQIDAINQVFMLFRVNYHNQYYSAYSDTNLLNQAKKLWSESLLRFSEKQILKGAKRCIEASDYLPTLNKMIGFCNDQLIEFGLPAVRDAFIEACMAASPKSAQSWSHSAVYLAGKDSSWFFLANNPEKLTFPVYEKRYRHYCERVLQGEQFKIVAPEALEDHRGQVLTREEQKVALKKMRENLDI